MGRVESSDPDVVVYRSGGGCISVFGLPFLAVGLFVLSSPFLPARYRLKDDKSGEAMPVAFPLVFGGVFAAVGAGLVLGRGGKTIDRRRGTATTWWGLLVPFRSKDIPLSDFDRVAIAREVRRSKNSTYTVYPVRLTGPGDAKVTLEEPQDKNKARALGEEIAKLLELKLADGSMGATVVREPGELDESLRDRVQRTGERPEVGAPPPGMRSVQSVEGDTLAFEIPPTGFKPVHLIPMCIGLAVPVFVYFMFFRHFPGGDKTPGAVRYLFLAFFVVFFVALPILATFGMALSSAKKRARVEVSPRELRVTEIGLVRSRTKAIPTDELEELKVASAKEMAEQRSSGALAGGDVLVARSDKMSLTFGTGLSRAELEWMRAVIWNVVTA